jgi:hypothetical protein
MAEHWSDDGLPTWDVKVGDRVRQSEDPGVAETDQQLMPPVGMLGTVMAVGAPADRQLARPEVLVRWDGIRYADPEEGSMATWIAPAIPQQGLQRRLDP